MTKDNLYNSINKFQIKNNELLIAEIPISQLDNLVGGTPFYAYDKKIITTNTNNLKNSLPNKIKLHYAIKANPLPSLVSFMATQVSGFDVASKNEMILALQSGMNKLNISFAGPGKTKKDIQAAIIAGVTLHTESLTEIEKVVDYAKRLHIKPNIAIRVNPIFELKSSGMKMSGGAKPFGIDEEILPSLLSKLPYKEINFRGFHIFAGSQNLNSDAIIEMHQHVFKLAFRLINITPVKIDYINIGGGLGIPYFSNDKALELSEIINNLNELLIQYKTNLTNINIIMELGRYLVGEAGIYVSKIIDKKISRGITYLICDGGLHHHLANSGNFGQVIRKNYPVVLGNKILAKKNKTELVTIVGPLCTPLDILAEKITLPEASIGDYIVIFQSGAYGATASPQAFLSQPLVKEILL